MSDRTSNKTVKVASFAAGVLFLSIPGCTQATRTTTSAPGTATPAFAAAGGLLSNFYNTARSVFESETVSLALDRIDQRDLPLDKTYRRRGTGAGVTVYVFDGGILPSHPELAGRVRKGFNAFDGDGEICNAHGTAVAGAIAGKSLGVAPEAKVVDVKMVECGKLRGTIKAIVDGANWVIQDHRRHGGPSVANWSFIADTAARIPALDSAVAALRAEGIPVIVSAGNVEVNACRVSPGNADGAVVVGASAIARDRSTNKVTDRRAYNTAYGQCIDFYAPGDSVLLPSFDAARTPSVQLWNGTSMSTGYVSGAVALFLEANPKASPDDALRFLRGTATMNVVQNTYAPVSWLLYVGPSRARPEMESVAEIRARIARR
ncbi:MAG TPA: S8 family peptidase [Hyphomicrobiaceae bacterium]|nr:S8 family peptidase [Hyphomicrobiaceae bacterium]